MTQARSRISDVKWEGVVNQILEKRHSGRQVSIEALSGQNPLFLKGNELLPAEQRLHPASEMQIRSLQRSMAWMTAIYKMRDKEGSIETF